MIIGKSRREIGGPLGLGAATFVTSIVVPTAGDASCRSFDQSAPLSAAA
jgi:hypothetical protein